VRMARVNISLPDEVHSAAKALGINVSHAARDAILQIVANRARMAEWDRMIAEEREANPPTVEQMADADAWADRVLARFREATRAGHDGDTGAVGGRGRKTA
jgi:post-segregation antitoxin (ccd killing protein)